MFARQTTALFLRSILCNFVFDASLAWALLKLTGSQATATNLAFDVGSIWLGSVVLTIKSGLARVIVFLLTKGGTVRKGRHSLRASCFPRHSPHSPSLMGVHDLKSYVEAVFSDESVTLAVKLEAAACQGFVAGASSHSFLGGLLLPSIMDRVLFKHLLGMLA